MSFSWYIRTFVFFFVTLFWCSAVNLAQAADCDQFQCDDKKGDNSAYIQCISEKKSCFEEKLSEVQQQKSSLTNEINVINGRINIQQLQIAQTLAEITKLEDEIEVLSQHIDNLNYSLDRLTTMLLERVKKQYKQRNVSPFSMMLASSDFQGLLRGQKYITIAGQQTATVMQQAEAQRLAFDEQKLKKQEVQVELENKRVLLEKQRAELANQRQSQQSLLTITKNNEKNYQELITQAQREIAQIQSAGSVVVREGNEVSIAKGEIVGTMGNSGYSTGAHLHFGVYQYTVDQFQNIDKWGWYYSKYVNPLEKLAATSVNWTTGCGHDPSGEQSSGSGSWQWPMSGAQLTQNYGNDTCYNFMYGGKTHPAIDMVSRTDFSVRAVEAGKGYFCRNCLGDGGNGVFIFHDGGYMTLYWHLK